MDIDVLPCGLIELDRNHKVQKVNKEFTNYGNFSSKEFLGKKVTELPFYEVYRHEDRKIDFKGCISAKKSYMQKSAMLRTKNGNMILVFINGKQIPDSKYILAIADISHEIACSTAPLSKYSMLEDSPLDAIVGKDEKIINIQRLIELAADSTANVMISGESGTGKELVANAIQLLSDRKEKPFIKVNCAAIPETLLESELFGHVKGSFTGAYRDKIGKFESAHNGTVFLDEISEISPMIQVKLLRAVQEKTIERIGDNKVIHVNMRIIAATNRSLRERVNKGLFREDLFYRLNVFPLYTVPLRDHKNDIPLLCDHFIKKFNVQTGKNIKGMTENAYRIMMDYCWPGNVRELENSIEHAFVLCNSRLIDVFDLPQDVRLVNLRQGLCKGIDATAKPAFFYAEPMVSGNGYKEGATVVSKSIGKEELLSILQSYGWSRNDTAKHLGISRVSLWKKMRKLGI